MSEIVFQFTEPGANASLSMVREPDGALWIRVTGGAVVMPQPAAERLAAFLSGKPHDAPQRSAPVLRVVSAPPVPAPSPIIPYSEAAALMGFGDPNEAA